MKINSNQKAIVLTRDLLFLFQVQQVFKVVVGVLIAVLAVIHSVFHELDEKLFRTSDREAELEPFAERRVDRVEHHVQHKSSRWQQESLRLLQDVRFLTFEAFRIHIVDRVRDDRNCVSGGQL